MARHVALLRGVNVGGVKVAMADLRAIAEGLGYDEVSTHLNSGNLLLSSRRRAATVAAELQAALTDRYGRELPVMVRSREELQDALARQPFAGGDRDPSRAQIGFLSEAPKSGAGEGLGPFDGEEWAVDGREVFLYYPDGMGRSKLTTAVLERALGTRVTVRAMRTVAGLVDRL